MHFIMKEYHLGIKYCLIHRNKFFIGKNKKSIRKLSFQNIRHI